MPTQAAPFRGTTTLQPWEDAMSRHCLDQAGSTPAPRFDSPLALWIAIWQRQLVDGWAEAASEIAPDESPTIRSWCRRRQAHIEAGCSHIIVGHEDLAAFPRLKSRG